MRHEIIIALIVLVWIGALAHIVLIGRKREDYSISTAVGSLIQSIILTVAWVYIYLGIN